MRAESMPRWIALFEELGKADPNVNGHELDEQRSAKVVKVRNGERIVTDGPFAETKEILGGIFLIELPDLDEAIRLASLIPSAEHGSIEIRPIIGGYATVTVEQVFREEWGRAVATLTRILGDLGLAEDAVQDAFTIALERWPRDGVSTNAGRVDRHDGPAPRDRPSSGAIESSVRRRSFSRGSSPCRSRRRT